MKGTEKSRRFSILLCDQSIELVLKEKIRSLGESIYVKGGSGKTVEFHDMLYNLRNNRGIKLPEYPDLEMIHDERNIIQHKGTTVSVTEAEYYIKKSFGFLKRFLKDELNLELIKIMDRRYYGIFEPTLIRSIFEPEIEISDTVKAEVRHRNPLWILPAYANLEKELLQQGKKFELHATDPKRVIDALVRMGKLSKEDSVKFNLIRDLRNRHAHTYEQIHGDDVEEFSEIVEELIMKVNKL
jgi:uncharacterized protein YutE (UPF0331/DUF86 family)